MGGRTHDSCGLAGKVPQSQGLPTALKRQPLPGPVREGGRKQRVQRLKTGKAKAAKRVCPGQAESYWWQRGERKAGFWEEIEITLLKRDFQKLCQAL